jgi:hypothetical protein
MQITKPAVAGIIAALTLATSTTLAYKAAYSSGYKTSISESRNGYMKIPDSSGSLTVSEIEGKKIHYFEPYPDIPTYRADQDWNSDENRKYLEHSIKTSAVRANDHSQKINVASAACAPQTTPNFWNCTWRELGNNHNNQWRVEVNPTNGQWQSS